MTATARASQPDQTLEKVVFVPPCLLASLERAAQAGDVLWAAKAKLSKIDITSRQFVVMHAVSVVPASSQARLAEVTGVDRSTLADMVHLLQVRGLLQRRRSIYDARAYTVTLTEQGEAVLRIARGVSIQVDDALTAQMTQGEVDDAWASLDLMAKASTSATA